MSDVSPVTPDSDSPEEPQIEPPISADTPDDESSASEIGDVETSPAAEAASPAESVSSPAEPAEEDSSMSALGPVPPPPSAPEDAKSEPADSEEPPAGQPEEPSAGQASPASPDASDTSEASADTPAVSATPEDAAESPVESSSEAPEPGQPPTAASAATGAFPVGPVMGVPGQPPTVPSAATGAFPVGPVMGVPGQPPTAASAATGAFPVGPVMGVPGQPPTAASAATGAFPMVAPAPPPPPSPMSPATRRQLKVGLGALALVLVLVIAGIAVVSLLNSRRTPEKEVSAYLALIADGHAEDANKMVDPGASHDESLLLTDEALGAATSRITAVKVEDADVDGDDDSALVTATFRLDGERFEHTFSVNRGDKEYGLLDNWEIEDPLINKVELTSSTFDSLTIGGQEVSLDNSEYTSSHETLQYVYFGVYDIAASSSRSKYLTPDTTSLQVDSSERVNSSKGAPDQTVTVSASPTQALKDLVLNKVKQETTDCTTPPNNMDSECPSAVQSRQISKMEVTTEASEVTIDSSATTFTSGKIVITTTKNSTYGGTPSTDTSRFKFEGDIDWDAGQEEPTVTVLRTTSAYY
ncbi:hypothetical protein [Actinomyces massiliensis]|uniref:hypothetical protein n=1 Tax=Actinomyces massiliensis TaxID=461393 RepID=UPI000314DD0D|nr:hypothetical protein [Actinomyces massiliensis]